MENIGEQKRPEKNDFIKNKQDVSRASSENSTAHPWLFSDFGEKFLQKIRTRGLHLLLWVLVTQACGIKLAFAMCLLQCLHCTDEAHIGRNRGSPVCRRCGMLHRTENGINGVRTELSTVSTKVRHFHPFSRALREREIYKSLFLKKTSKYFFD